MRNRDEIFPREKALSLLGLEGEKKTALYSISGHPEDYDRLLDKYSYLEKEGYEVIRSSTHRDAIFPAVDYFNAFDLVICGAGYNQVWEANFFRKKALFETTPLRFSEQSSRIRQSQGFHFDVNGADQLVDIIMNL
jgi:hypothetical protein